MAKDILEQVRALYEKAEAEWPQVEGDEQYIALGSFLADLGKVLDPTPNKIVPNVTENAVYFVEVANNQDNYSMTEAEAHTLAEGKAGAACVLDSFSNGSDGFQQIWKFRAMKSSIR